MTRPTLIIFAKPPRIGLSKTRLAHDVGRAESRRIARFTLARTMLAADERRAWQTRLHVTPLSAVQETLGGLWPRHIPRYRQGHGGLGDRLAQAMREAPRGPVIFIGADTPDISRGALLLASRRLRHNGAVLGPAADGGFWLLGLSQSLRDPRIFSKVRWSTPHAMEDVWSNLPAHARISLLPQLLDIDTGKDWKLFRNQS